MRRVLYNDGSDPIEVKPHSARTIIACEQEYSAPYTENVKYFERVLWMTWYQLKSDKLVELPFMQWVTRFDGFDDDEFADGDLSRSPLSIAQ